MKEITQTLAILKVRWKEVVFIIATHVLWLLLHTMVSGAKSSSEGIVILIIYFVDIAILFTSLTLLLGFERTVYLKGNKPQSPILLLHVGKHFLLRYFVGILLLGIICMILIWLVFLITKPFFHLDTGLFETTNVYPFAYIFNASVASIVIVKLFLFVPAVILVYDCKLFRSLNLLKQHRLRGAKELVFLYVVLIVGGNLLWALGLSLNNATTVLHYILVIVYFIIRQFLWLTVATMAVLYVGRCSPDKEKVEEE